MIVIIVEMMLRLTWQVINFVGIVYLIVVEIVCVIITYKLH